MTVSTIPLMLAWMSTVKLSSSSPGTSSISSWDDKRVDGIKCPFRAAILCAKRSCEPCSSTKTILEDAWSAEANDSGCAVLLSFEGCFSDSLSLLPERRMSRYHLLRAEQVTTPVSELSCRLKRKQWYSDIPTLFFLHVLYYFPLPQKNSPSFSSQHHPHRLALTQKSCERNQLFFEDPLLFICIWFLSSLQVIIFLLNLHYAKDVMWS